MYIEHNQSESRRSAGVGRGKCVLAKAMTRRSVYAEAAKRQGRREWGRHESLTRSLGPRGPLALAGFLSSPPRRLKSAANGFPRERYSQSRNAGQNACPTVSAVRPYGTKFDQMGLNSSAFFIFLDEQQSNEAIKRTGDASWGRDDRRGTDAKLGAKNRNQLKRVAPNCTELHPVAPNCTYFFEIISEHARSA